MVVVAPAPREAVAAPPAARGVAAPNLASPKGKIVCSSDRSSGYPELWLINAGGSNQ